MLTDDPADQGASAEAFRVLTTIVNGRLKRRLLTVVDATSLRAGNRASYRRLAARYGIPSVAIAFDLPERVYRERNAARPDRKVAEGVIADQAERMIAAVAGLGAEGFQSVFVVTERDTIDHIAVERITTTSRG